MAGTGADDTTPDNWRLAGDELAFVAQYIQIEQAKELLLAAPTVHGVRWLCACVRVNEKRDYQASPPLETSPAAALLFFWRRDEDTRFDMDWPANCAYRVGPVVKLGLDGRGNSWPIVDARALSEWTATLVRYHHGDVVNMLVKLGLIPQSPAPPPEPTPIAPQIEAAPAAPASQDNPESELPSATVVPALATTPTTRLGKQERLITEVALEIYGEDLPLLTPTELQQAIEARQKAKTLKTQLPPHWVPSWDACKRFLQKRGKLRLR